MPEPTDINSPEVVKTPGGSGGPGKEDGMMNGHKEGETNPFAEYMWMENEEEYNRQVEEELLEQEFLERCFQEMLEEEDQDWFIPSRDLAPGLGHIQQQFSSLSVGDSNAEDIAKWKRHWLTLYPNSRQGVARLELAEAGSDRSPVLVRRQPERKIIRLSECISVVRLPPNAEAHPVENMAAFCVTTDEKKMVFSVERDECGDWVDKICDMAFQQKGRGNGTQMEENEIYTSRQEAAEFQVLVEQSEASVRCNLQGVYVLQVCGEVLLLKDIETMQKVLEWPYKLLRRYGCDKLSFSFEAGRRCDSGPGMFLFETKQGEDILHLMEQAIQQQKNLAVPGGVSSVLSPSSPLPKTPTMSFLEVYSNTESGANPQSDATSPRIVKRHSQPIFQDECAYSQPADIIKSQRNVHGVKPGPFKCSEHVYSVPVDVLQPRPVPPKPVFGNELRSAGTPHTGQAEPVYAEVLYFTQKKGSQNKEETVVRLAEGSNAHGDANTGALKSKQDSDSTAEVIYSQVYKPSKSTKMQE